MPNAFTIRITTNAATSVDNTEIADSAQIDDTDFDGVESDGDTAHGVDSYGEVDVPAGDDDDTDESTGDVEALVARVEALILDGKTDISDDEKFMKLQQKADALLQQMGDWVFYQDDFIVLARFFDTLTSLAKKYPSMCDGQLE